MKLNDGFIVYDTNGETLLVPRGGSAFAGLVRGNRTFGRILELLKTDTTENEIVSTIAAEFPEAEERIRQDVKKVLDNLKDIGALV